MPTLPTYIANAFSAGPFTGNPAAVVPYRGSAVPLSAKHMQALAEQNNLAETAFVNLDGLRGGGYPLRWFTPAQEVRLCGHATLASAEVLRAYAKTLGIAPRETYRFDTRSGRLSCEREATGWTMDFPADPPADAPTLARVLAQAPAQGAGDGRAGERPVFRGRDDALLVLETAAAVRDYVPHGPTIRALGTRGLIVTGPGDDEPEFDVVSRCFYPEFGIDEDPATGSAHTLIGAYWCARLGKPELRCLQASRRRGVLGVRHDGGKRLELSGAVELYLRGEITY